MPHHARSIARRIAGALTAAAAMLALSAAPATASNVGGGGGGITPIGGGTYTQYTYIFDDANAATISGQAAESNLRI